MTMSKTILNCKYKRFSGEKMLIAVTNSLTSMRGMWNFLCAVCQSLASRLAENEK